MCLVPPLDFSLYFCYTKPTRGDNWTFVSKVEVLKKALAKALVPYYALAGEIVTNSVREPEILCSNRGVTGFKCGGLMVACTFGHKIMDGYSAGMFLISWAEIAQSIPLSSLPTFCRSLLNPRIPGSFDSSLENLYIPITSFHPIKEPNLGGNNFVSRAYIVKANIINQIQSLASTNECKRTKVECFSALLWKIIAKRGTADKIYPNWAFLLMEGQELAVKKKRKQRYWLLTLEICGQFPMEARP
ncbi:fatty alcohol:caffeoyl-coa acyltransferase [Quercus suber]|uniref:Fatty alcohol:caffeoyl-coa acyltransferase n=1 Tax=Quercus suber TaxID=58331 RepID=A0AAW0IUF4_QUESU